MDGHIGLSARDGLFDESVNLFNDSVGHCKATDRRTAAMDEDMRPVSGLHLVEDVGKTKIERARPPPDVTHLRTGDRVETLRRLLVAFAQLRPERPGPMTDGIRRKQHVRGVVFANPDFEFRFGLEHTQQHRRAEFNPFVRQPFVEPRKIGRAGQRKISFGSGALALDAITRHIL